MQRLGWTRIADFGGCEGVDDDRKYYLHVESADYP